MRKRAYCFAVVVILFVVAASQAFGSSGAGPGVSPDQALQMLKDGNAAYVAGRARHLNADSKRRELTTVNGQHPFVSILSCSDSRAPVSVIFGAGIGDIFTVRVAGNVAATDEIGSLEYAVEHLGTRLVVVLGHTHCGAVSAVVKGARYDGNIDPLVAHIAPAVARVKAQHPGLTGDALLEGAIKANVWNSIEDALKKSAILREKVKSGSVKIVGAVYHIDSGKVEWMGTDQNQAKLLRTASKKR